MTGRRYDHASGRFSLPEVLSANDVVIASGLHALYPPDLVAHLDVRIFLEVDEALRRHWKLGRDTQRRDQDAAQVIEAMARRRPDGERYIQPQAGAAELVFKLSASNAELKWCPIFAGGIVGVLLQVVVGFFVGLSTGQPLSNGTILVWGVVTIFIAFLISAGISEDRRLLHGVSGGGLVIFVNLMLTLVLFVIENDPTN